MLDLSLIKKLKTKTFVNIFYIVWDRLFHRELYMGRFFKLKKHYGWETIKTYDGSGQCVHPDIMEYHGDIYIVFTPYPYGIDTYENPSLLKYDMVYNKWISIHTLNNPLVRENNYHYHLSDPCLFEKDGELCVLYRKTEKNIKKSSNLYYLTIDVINRKFCTPRKLMKKKGDYISPALVYGDTWYLFFVETGKQNNLLVINNSNDNLKDEKVLIRGLRSDMQIWHVGMASADNWNSKVSADSIFDVLITTIDVRGNYYLYYGKLKKELCWELNMLFLLENDVINNANIVYKSSFSQTNNEKKIFVSICDKEHRWRIYSFSWSQFLSRNTVDFFE